jgi:DNA-binding NarL/FixJ family response regulator
MTTAPEATVERNFTARELDVLFLIGHGKTTKEIAFSLNLSVGTVRAHRRNMCRKLAIHSTAELVSFATSWLFSTKRPMR